MIYTPVIIFITDPETFDFEETRGFNNVIYFINDKILSMRDFEFIYRAYLRPTASSIEIGDLIVYEK